jgi:hypothetical protein
VRTVTGERLRAALPFCFGGEESMERKRIAGRFAAEDKNEIAKKPTPPAPQPRTRGKNLFRLLVDRLKNRYAI